MDEEVSAYDESAIRGCLLSGAKPLEVYAAFYGAYPMKTILRIYDDLINEGKLHGTGRSLV